MKTLVNRILAFIFLMIVVGACDKNDDTIIEDRPLSANEIRGSVILPEGSTLDINTLTIASPVDVVSVSGSAYQMETLRDQFLTQLVTDASGKIMLMGFIYPDQIDFEINSTSTALAILMNFPVALQSAPQVKQELITKILNHPNFGDLVAAIDKVIVNGIGLLDESNRELGETITVFYSKLLFPEPGKTRKMDYSSDPVDIRLANNEITFVNLGKTYETVVGIYKDDVKVKNINVERITFLPTTIGDAIGAFASAYGGTELPGNLQPKEYKYTFESDGQYDIKIRTSKLVDDAIENDIALLNNIINWGVDLIVEVLPLGDCVQPMIANFKQHVQTFGSFSSATTEQEKLGLLYDVLYTFLNETTTLIQCFIGAEELEDYLKKFGTVLKFIDLVGKIGNGGNILVGIAQLVTDEGILDKCYQVEGGVVTECNTKGVYVAGYEILGSDKSVAKVWKNGVATSLTNGSTRAYAASVYISENDVFVAGYENDGNNYNGNDNYLVAKVWKNGVAISLTDGSTNGRANSVYVSGDDVYVAGTKATIATIWKNGVAISLTSVQSEAHSIYISNNDVYVAGAVSNENGQTIATVWKNDVATSLTNGFSRNIANSVYVSDTDVYVAGSGGGDNGGTYYIAKAWKNGNLTPLSDGSNNDEYATSIFVSDNDVYVSGYETIANDKWVAKIWKNGVATSLSNDGYVNTTSIYVSGNDVYVSGNEQLINNKWVPKVWKNGVVTSLTDGATTDIVTSIFVKEE